MHLGRESDAGVRASTCNCKRCLSSRNPGVASTPNYPQGYDGIPKYVAWWCPATSFKGLLDTTSATSTGGRPLLCSNFQFRFRNTGASYPSNNYHAPVLTGKRRLGFQTTPTLTGDYQVIHTLHTRRVDRYVRACHRV